MVRLTLDISGVAEYLGTTEHHVRALIRRDAIPYFKVGRLIRFDQDVIDEWLEANRQGAR